MLMCCLKEEGRAPRYDGKGLQMFRRGRETCMAATAQRREEKGDGKLPATNEKHQDPDHVCHKPPNEGPSKHLSAPSHNNNNLASEFDVVRITDIPTEVSWTRSDYAAGQDETGKSQGISMLFSASCRMREKRALFYLRILLPQRDSEGCRQNFVYIIPENIRTLKYTPQTTQDIDEIASFQFELHKAPISVAPNASLESYFCQSKGHILKGLRELGTQLDIRLYIRMDDNDESIREHLLRISQAFSFSGLAFTRNEVNFGTLYGGQGGVIVSGDWDYTKPGRWRKRMRPVQPPSYNTTLSAPPQQQKPPTPSPKAPNKRRRVDEQQEDDSARAVADSEQYDQIHGQVQEDHDLPQHEVPCQIEGQLLHRLREELKSQIREELRDELRDEILNEIRNEVRGELRVGLERIRDILGAEQEAYVRGYMDSFWRIR